MNKTEPYVALAEASLESYVKKSKLLQVPQGLPPEMTNKQAGVFVSIKKNGALRGCIGTISPTMDNIAMEIIRNAVSAGVEDPRFSPVQADELPELTISVDVLDQPEPIQAIDELNVREYGVIVSNGRRRGLLLPNLEGVDTPEEQVGIALQKAGILPHESYQMERFRVVRHK